MQKESPFIAVSAQRRNGLILCKAYHAEFAGPGAAIGRPCDFDCEFAIALGKKWKLVDVSTAEEAQNAYRRRIQWMYWLKKITEQKQPLQRAEALLSSFDAFFDAEAIAALPPFVLARLVGVFEGTMAQVHRQHYEALGMTVPAVAEPNRHWHYVELPHSLAPDQPPAPQSVVPAQTRFPKSRNSLIMF